jgi:hypothetical protein
MKLQKLTKQEFNDTQYNNRPIGAFYYIQELDETVNIYHGLIITNRYQLFAEFTNLPDLQDWAIKEFPDIP